METVHRICLTATTIVARTAWWRLKSAWVLKLTCPLVNSTPNFVRNRMPKKVVLAGKQASMEANTAIKGEEVDKFIAVIGVHQQDSGRNTGVVEGTIGSC